jgi:hypothetical protein
MAAGTIAHPQYFGNAAYFDRVLKESERFCIDPAAADIHLSERFQAKRRGKSVRRYAEPECWCYNFDRLGRRWGLPSVHDRLSTIKCDFARSESLDLGSSGSYEVQAQRLNGLKSENECVVASARAVVGEAGQTPRSGRAGLRGQIRTERAIH